MVGIRQAKKYNLTQISEEDQSKSGIQSDETPKESYLTFMIHLEQFERKPPESEIPHDWYVNVSKSYLPYYLIPELYAQTNISESNYILTQKGFYESMVKNFPVHFIKDLMIEAITSSEDMYIKLNAVLKVNINLKPKLFFYPFGKVGLNYLHTQNKEDIFLCGHQIAIKSRGLKNLKQMIENDINNIQSNEIPMPLQYQNVEESFSVEDFSDSDDANQYTLDSKTKKLRPVVMDITWFSTFKNEQEQRFVYYSDLVAVNGMIFEVIKPLKYKQEMEVSS